MEQHVITLFHESIEAKMQAGEYLAPLLCEASEMMVHSLLNDGKIMVVGNNTSAACAQILASNLINRFEHERPSLPAIALGNDFTSLSAIADDHSYSEIFAKQIRALGQAGDTLVIITERGLGNNLVQAVSAAHEREIHVIVLSGQDGGNLSSVLELNDIEMRVPVNSTTRIHEIHLLSVFCLCDLIDQQLFGTGEQ